MFCISSVYLQLTKILRELHVSVLIPLYPPGVVILIEYEMIKDINNIK